MGYIQPTACFANKILLENRHIHSFTHCQWLFLCHHGRAEWLWQRPHGFTKTKMLSCFLQKKFAYPVLNLCVSGSQFTKGAPRSHVFYVITESLFVYCWSLLFCPNYLSKGMCSLWHPVGILSPPSLKLTSIWATLTSVCLARWVVESCVKFPLVYQQYLCQVFFLITFC